MAGILLPGQFTNQPQYPAQVNWGNPITRGLIVAINPGGGMVEAVTRRVITDRHIGTDLDVSVEGERFRTNAVSEYARIPSIPGSMRPALAASIFWMGEYLGASTNSAMLFGLNHNANGDAVPYVSVTLKRGTAFLDDLLQINDGTTSRNVAVTQARPTTGRVKMLGRTITGTQNVQRRIVGVADYNASATWTYSAIAYGAGAELAIGDPLTLAARNANASMAVGYIWDRYITDAERQSVMDFPWQIWQAPGRIFPISDAAAASGFKPYWSSQRPRVYGAGVR